MQANQLQVAVQHLSRYNLEVTVEPYSWTHPAFEHQTITLHGGGNRQGYVIVDDPLDYRPIPFEETNRRLLILPYINERQAKKYRDQDLNFVDEAGNAFIAFASVYIDVRGRRSSVRTSTPTEPSASGINLFSARRSRVLFVVLTWPYTSQLTVREISDLSGVSVGLAQETLKLLQREEYLSLGPQPRVLRQRWLFEQWVTTYPHQLAPKLALEAFRTQGSDFLPELAPGMEFGGESAIPDLLNPSTLTVYVQEFLPKFAVMHRWRRDPQPNVFIRKKFWRDPSSLDIEGPKASDKAPTVPSTLVYADLIASGEPRQYEAAQILKEHDERLLRIFRS